jgi:hypothetical protein
LRKPAGQRVKYKWSHSAQAVGQNNFIPKTSWGT